MNSKQDRQGVRTPKDIETKYNLGGLKNPQGSAEIEIQISNLTQTLNQFINDATAKLADINKDINDINEKVDNFEGGDGLTDTEVAELIKNKADLVDGKISSEQLPEFIGDVYTAYKTAQIVTADIDTLTDGASITVPSGVYVITASVSITTGTSAGIRNNQIRILAGNTSLVIHRVVAAAQNYGALQASAIYKATAETKLTVQKSSSIPENAESGTKITALRIVSGGSNSSSGGEGLTEEEIAVLLESIDKIYAKKEDIPTVPTKVSAFENDKGYLTEHQSLEGYAKTTDMPTVPTKVSAFENDSGYLKTETDPTVPAWAKTENKPVYTADEVGADAEGTASNLVSAHNTGTDAHNDIRLLIQGLTARLDAVANSSDDDLDQLSEIVAYIKSNKSLIDSITTTKVNVSDIINNLVTAVTDKPLSAAMGVMLKTMIDEITVPTKVSQLQNDIGYLTQHQDLSAYAKKTEIPTVPTKLSQFTNDEEFISKTDVQTMLTQLETKIYNTYLGGYKWRVGTTAETGYVTVKKG